MKAKRRSFLIAMAVGAVIAALTFLLTGSYGRSFVHRLCDGFFVAAVFLIGSGGLIFVSNYGLFDIFGYGFRSIFGIHMPWVTSSGKRDESFAEYRERKHERQKPPWTLLLSGCVYLVLASVMLIAFYSVG